jgi:hypothetical protein
MMSALTGLHDAVPVRGAEGPEVTRSAAALSDMITWRAVDEARATAVLQVGST